MRRSCAAATLLALAIRVALAESPPNPGLNLTAYGLGPARIDGRPSGLHSVHEHVPELPKLLDRIARDLDAWKDGITLEMVERTYCTDYEASFRLQIVDGLAYIVGEMPGFFEFNRHTKLFILDVMKRHRLPDVDIVFSTSDRCPGPRMGFGGNMTRCPNEAPLFSFDKRAEDSHCVLFPDFTFSSGGWPLAKLPGWEDARDIMELAVANLSMQPLESRIPKLFFRGAPTGSRGLLADDWGFVNHQDVDFRLTGWTGDTEQGQYVALPDHCKYQYLLNLPGNGYSARLKYLLMCGSPVIFPFGGLEEFFHHLLEDGVHLVRTPPLNEWERGGPTLEALRALQEDPKRAARIAAAGRDLVKRVLTPETVHRYFAELLHHYAALQTFQPTVHPDAVPIHSSAMGADALNTIETRTCTICANQPT